jgi:Fe-S oxidoreductase
MSGKLAAESDQAVYETLDLCLECRACKAECPVNVDMARHKSEFLAGYYERHGTPLSARALGGIAKLSPLASAFAPMSNWVAGMAKSAIGVDHRRSLPKWRRQTLWGRAFSPPPGFRPAHAPAHLFADTFTNHFDPEIGFAALEILISAAVPAKVVRPGCCGRPLISKGLLKEARVNAEKLANSGLHEAAKRGEKILFLEPSCLSAVKEDLPSLLRGDLQVRARDIAQACVLFDEFASKLDLPLKKGPAKILLHGHCHQKSMGMLSASQALLAKIPGATVVDLDAGCCGMAGSFGYAKEHYDVSVAIANRKLLPAVKSMQPGDVLVAPGTSCRHQVADLAGAAALHPAQLIQSLL